MSRRIAVVSAVVVVGLACGQTRDLKPSDPRRDAAADQVTPVDTGGDDRSTSDDRVTTADASTDDRIASDGPADGDLGCAPDPTAPWSTSSRQRPIVQWSVYLPGERPADAGAAAPFLDAGAVSGCTKAGMRVDCQGAAAVRNAAGPAELVFGDGSAIVWTPDASLALEPPALSEGQVVWVTYAQAYTVVCPFCGAYTTRQLQIRSGGSADGPYLWVGQDGAVLPEIGDPMVTDLFGVSAQRVFACHAAGTAGCYAVERSVFDHVLATTPAVTIPHATLTHVTTPKGNYQLFWASTTETKMFMPNCADGPDVANDRAFMASRLGP